MNDYKTITRLFENDQDEFGFRLFKESNIIKFVSIFNILETKYTRDQLQ